MQPCYENILVLEALSNFKRLSNSDQGAVIIFPKMKVDIGHYKRADHNNPRSRPLSIFRDFDQLGKTYVYINFLSHFLSNDLNLNYIIIKIIWNLYILYKYYFNHENLIVFEYISNNLYLYSSNNIWAWGAILFNASN